MANNRQKSLWVTSLYGYKSGSPLVSVAMPGGEFVQLSPENARNLARDLFECAEAAEQDAFMFSWVQEQIKVSPDKAAIVLNDFREWRARRNG